MLYIHNQFLQNQSKCVVSRSFTCSILEMFRFVVKQEASDQTVVLQLSNDPAVKISISCNPFRLDVYDENEPVFSLNSRQLLNIEHLREKPISKPPYVYPGFFFVLL